MKIDSVWPHRGYEVIMVNKTLRQVLNKRRSRKCHRLIEAVWGYHYVIYSRRLLELFKQLSLFVFYVPSTATSFLETAPLAKDEKLGKYTVPTGNRTPGRRVAVHYSTAAPRQLPKPLSTNHKRIVKICRRFRIYSKTPL